MPSGRVLDNLAVLSKEENAGLLTAPGYCATSWEAGANFLSGQEKPHPDCSEVVIDLHGWVHPCCWHELAPGLFNLAKTKFDAGMEHARKVPFCQAIDEGDMIKPSEIAGITTELAHQVRDVVGDCGACRLCSVKLAADPQHNWMKPTTLTERETRFYNHHLGETMMVALFAADSVIPVSAL